VISYREDAFFSFVRKLRRKYAGQWIALAINHEDYETGETRGTIVAHGWTQSGTLQAAGAYHAVHPETTIRFFTTDVVLTGPVGF
jgi:hypothetical protein